MHLCCLVNLARMRHQNGWSSTPLWLCYRCRSTLKLRTMMSTIKIQRCCWTMGVDVNLVHDTQVGFDAGVLLQNKITPCESLLDSGPSQREPLWHILVYLKTSGEISFYCQKVVLGPLHVIYFALSPYASSLLCHSQDTSQFFFPLPITVLIFLLSLGGCFSLHD
jgi:hypothetical protein